MRAGSSTIPEQWTLRSLAARHRRATVGAVLLVALLLGLFLVDVLGPRAGAISNYTSCQQWGSSTQAEQQAYARQYLQNDRSSSRLKSVSAVQRAITFACLNAYSYDEESTVTVLQAVRGRY